MNGAEPADSNAKKYRWFITHECGIPWGIPSMAWRVCVGTAMTGIMRNGSS